MLIIILLKLFWLLLLLLLLLHHLLRRLFHPFFFMIISYLIYLISFYLISFYLFSFELTSHFLWQAFIFLIFFSNFMRFSLVSDLRVLFVELLSFHKYHIKQNQEQIVLLHLIIDFLIYDHNSALKYTYRIVILVFLTIYIAICLTRQHFCIIYAHH